MENSINKQFKMNQGAHAENNTVSTFRNPERVAQAGGMPMMGDPINYGTPSPVTKHEPGHKETDGERRDRQSVGQRDGAVANRKTKIGGVTVKARVGKERGATDLLEEGKKVYRKVKNYFSS